MLFESASNTPLLPLSTSIPPTRIYNQENSDFQIEKRGNRINILKDELRTSVLSSFIFWRTCTIHSDSPTMSFGNCFEIILATEKKKNFDKAEKEITTNLCNYLGQNDFNVVISSGTLIN
ncbi:hypothetical protein GcC1_119028 [Golovinomyces cichoracearum]|uniref:Uncharacterized protein n=1 Tax=Golovinomyces cichoracearum TaxID=62708 RepID=A0A420I787_9PEZI|nr:hypothetical protein GcC1_119028 [Golovinomyces cichoracearum]